MLSKNTNYSNISGGFISEMFIKNDLDSMCGISDDELIRRFKEAIRIDNEIKAVKGTPIAVYDPKTGDSYLEYPDGRREYATD